MRSLLARLFLAGLVGAVIAGCGTSGSSQLSGLPNGNGGGSAPYTNNPTSTKTATPLFANPVVIDNGTEITATPGPTPTGSATATPAPAVNVYKAILGSTSSDVGIAGGVGASPYPTGGPSYAPVNYPSTTVAHQVSFGGGGSQQVILQFAKTVPNLTYHYNSTAPTGTTPAYYDYSTVVAYLEYVPSATAPPGALASVSLEVTGSDAAGSFDVRVPCSGGIPSATAFTRLSCGPLPALGAVANTVGPNPILPGSLLGFDPTSTFTPRLSFVLNYTLPVATTSTGNVLDITNVYALQ